MTSRLDKLLDNAGAIAKISAALADDEHFRAFCVALNLPAARTTALVKKDDRAYSALRDWSKAIRTLDDFVLVLVKCDHEKLANEIGLGDEYENQKGKFWKIFFGVVIVICAVLFAVYLSRQNQPIEYTIERPALLVDRPELDSLFSFAAHSNSNPVIVLCSGNGVPGGTGKTSLARALAAKIRSEGLFPGHHLMLELKGAMHNTTEEREKAIRSAKEFVIESCGGMRVDATMKEDDFSRLYKNALSKVGLLLIDDASHADDVRALLSDGAVSATSTLKSVSRCVIVTTREDLFLPDSYVENIGLLNDKDSISLLRKFMPWNAVVVDGDLHQVAVKCGHIALALSIVGPAVASSYTFSAQEMIDKFVLKDIAYGMNATLQWSYDALGAQQKEVLQKSALFPFPFTKQAFNATFAIDGVTDLQNLTNRGWLQWLKEERRFALHDVVREYVYSQTDANQRVKMSNAVRKYFVDVIRVAEEKYSTKEYLNAIKSLNSEITSVLWLLETDADGLLLNLQIVPFGAFNLLVSAQHRLVYFKAIVDRSNNGDVNAHLLTAMHHYGWALKSRGEHEEALTILRDVFVRRCKLLGIEHIDTLFSQQCLGVALRNSGKFVEAETFSTQCYQFKNTRLETSILLC